MIRSTSNSPTSSTPESELYRFATTPLLPKLPGLEEVVPEDQFRQSLIERAQKRRRWRERRSAPPKCIRCGSTEITTLPNNKPVPNPEGDGTITVSISGMCSTDFNEWYFTPEGDRIPRDTKSTYWHHPVLDQPSNRSKLKQLLARLVKGSNSR